MKPLARHYQSRRWLIVRVRLGSFAASFKERASRPCNKLALFGPANEREKREKEKKRRGQSSMVQAVRSAPVTFFRDTRAGKRGDGGRRGKVS